MLCDWGNHLYMLKQGEVTRHLFEPNNVTTIENCTFKKKVNRTNESLRAFLHEF